MSLLVNPHYQIAITLQQHLCLYQGNLKLGIHSGGHLAVTYEGELLYLQMFSYLSPPRKHELPFSHGLKSGMVIMITIMSADRTKPKGTTSHLHT